jgi:hypothetical protein
MAHLLILVAEFGEDVPYVGGLARGFPFRGARVPFLNRQKGIYRAAAQSGAAALAIQTSANSPYDDQILADGFDYAYRAGPIDQPDNRALRAAHELQVPLVYFIGTRPGWYKPVFPCYVREDDPGRRMVIVTPRSPVRPARRARVGTAGGSDRAPLRRSTNTGPLASGSVPRPRRPRIQQPVRYLSTEGAPPSRCGTYCGRRRRARRAGGKQRPKSLFNPSPGIRPRPCRHLARLRRPCLSAAT